jgi:hypothetical protein
MAMLNMGPIIETQDLSKAYGHFGALHGLNIAVPEGQRICTDGRQRSMQNHGEAP